MGTVFSTVICGVLVYVLGQAVLNFILIPLRELRVIIGEIKYYIGYYENLHPNTATKEELNEAHEKFRELAFSLETKAFSVPFYDFVRIPSWPKKGDINNAVGELIGYSNGVFQTNHEFDNTRGINSGQRRRQKINEHLKLT